ncbi:MAG: NAD(P)/FAD-dependent oxidoreductase [Pseudomonadota bacterium]
MAEDRQKIAVIGTGISGLSAAWLLSQNHDVTVFERSPRIGGHSHTVSISLREGIVPVDIGFIVYNEVTYPNLTALFNHLGVPTQASDMSFAVSMKSGALEYSGSSLGTLFAQKRNLVRPRFWSMLKDLLRFYREAPLDLSRLKDTGVTLGAYLSANGYGAAFRDDHLLPMACAVWSAPASILQNYPAAAFIRFCENHGLLKIVDRPLWRTVTGGSKTYVEKIAQRFASRIRLGADIAAIRRSPDAVTIEERTGGASRFDHVVIASHADQALRLLADPTSEERRLLGAFRYSQNDIYLHTDDALMPRRRAAWSSWNYLDGASASDRVSVTYWMNRLQNIPCDTQLFVTLNPKRPPQDGTILHRQMFEHPIFDPQAMAAQSQLWSLQGRRRTWFCGAYFGSGFHEDGLQAGLAVAEQLGGVRRPWVVPNESGRIVLSAPPLELAA